MKGSVYPALRHSHKGKIQSLLGRDPSLPNPDPGSTLFPSSSRFSPSTHQPFPQPLFQPPTLISPLASTFTLHQPSVSLFPSVHRPLRRLVLPFHLSSTLVYSRLVRSRPSLSLCRVCPPSLTFYHPPPYHPPTCSLAKSDALLQDVGSRGI